MSDNAVTLREYVDVRFEAQEKGVQTALSAAEKAVIKAETAADKRFELLNELRQGVATTEQLEAVEKLVQGLTDRINRTEGKSTGLHAGWAYLLASIGMMATIISVILAFNN